MFRTASKRVANEAHQRLIEQEESWETVIGRWGVEADKKTKGKYFQLKPSKLHQEVYRELKKLKVGEVSEIIRTGKYISIVRLLKFNNIELNEELRATIEKELYQGWIDEKTKYVIKKMG